MEKPSYLFDKTLIFRHIPLFSELNVFQKRLVFDSLEIAEYKKSETIYRQGDAPDAFYCIITGRVHIYTEKDGAEETLEYLHRGKYFGFLSLLTGDPHSVSTRAATDTVIAKIPKDDFSAILKSIPRLAIDLSSMLSRRLKKRELHPKSVFESTIIVVYGDEHESAATSFYSLNLACGLREQTKKRVILVDVESEDSIISDALGIDVSFGYAITERFFGTDEVANKITKDARGIDVLRILKSDAETPAAPFLISLVTMLVNEYHYCVVHLASNFGEEAFKVLSQSDAVHLLVASEPELVQKMSRLLDESGVWTDEELKRKIKIILLEEEGSHGKGPKLSVLQEESFFHSPVFATLPCVIEKKYFFDSAGPEDPYLKTIRRISRQLGEVLVGLTLGSGAAMGISHIGVLKVLEKEGIPIDVTAGSSMGALIASLWCLGHSASELEQIMLEHRGKKFLFGFDDFAFNLRGLIQGKHIQRFLRRYLKDATFADLKRPLKIIACDCLSMRQVVFESGRLADAVLASISIPGIFQPHRVGNRFYIDGGILNPLPTDVLIECGARKILAVNVLPSPEEIERTYELLTQEEIRRGARFSFFKKFIAFAQQKSWEFLRPNIFDVLVSSVQSMEYLLAQLSSLSQSDVTLHPDVTGISWSAFDDAEELIRRGEEEARLHLKEIKELIGQKD